MKSYFYKSLMTYRRGWFKRQKKISLQPKKKNVAVFYFLIVSNCMVNPDPKLLIFFKYQKFRVSEGKPYNQTQWHKDFDFCFVSKCLYISKVV